MLALLLSIQTALAVPVPPTEVWVYAPDAERRAQLNALPLGFAEGEDAGWLRMHTDNKGFTALHASGLRWRPSTRALLPGDYLQPDEMLEALSALSAEYPDRSRLISLGRSTEGHPVVAIRISSTPTPRMNWRILGAHHGDETSSAEVALDAAEMLLETEQTSLLELLDKDAVWVVPHVNPDGVAALTRYNQNGIDLNRNYGYQWSPEEFRSGPAPFSEPETRNIRTLSAWIPFGAGLSTHSGATNIGWVWNYTTERTDEDALLESMAQAYGESCAQDGFYITNGADWYITHGDTTDWSFGRYGTLDYTLEVSDNKSPGPSEMAQVLDEHRDSIRAFLTWPWIIGGQVVDIETGFGIQSRVEFNEGIPIITGPDGRFGRPVENEDIEITISAPGYQSKTLLLSPHESPPLTRLEPQRLISARPSPSRLLPNQETTFNLDIDAETVRLIRPGHAPAEANPEDENRWSIDTTGMNAGPWTLMVDDHFSLNSIFIMDLDALVKVEAVAYALTEISISGEGFALGTELWAILGSNRSLVRLPLRSVSDTLVVAERPETLSELDDMVLVSQGRQISILPSASDEPEDTGSATEEDEPDTSESDSEPREEQPTELPARDSKLKASGCSTVQGYPVFSLLVSLFGLLFRRRESCATS